MRGSQKRDRKCENQEGFTTVGDNRNKLREVTRGRTSGRRNGRILWRKLLANKERGGGGNS